VHLAGKLHFVKFETAKIDQMLDFIEAKGLHRLPNGGGGAARIRATGGGAYKFEQLFKVFVLPKQPTVMLNDA
jgi:pantothenate kinase